MAIIGHFMCCYTVTGESLIKAYNRHITTFILRGTSPKAFSGDRVISIFLDIKRRSANNYICEAYWTFARVP